MFKARLMSIVCSMILIGALFFAAFFVGLADVETDFFYAWECGCNASISNNNPNPFPMTFNGPKLIALTFDDGPSVYTLQLLDALIEREAVATFFTHGEAVNMYPYIARRILQEGHEIACHAYSHPFLTKLTEEEIRRELTNSRNAIYNATGVVPAVHRPPYGSHDSLVRSVVAEFGMPLVLWNIETADWRDRDVDLILSRVINSRGVPLVQSGDIIILHDTLQTTVDAAIKMVDLLQEHGFRFVTVSQLFDAKGIQMIPGAVYGCAR